MGARILVVVGARPNFVKVAPVWHALQETGAVETRLLHTGQHYDAVLSDAFFEQLGLPRPDFFLGVGSGSHAEQTAGVLTGTERVLLEHRFDAVLVAGDVNSTMAAALAAAKLGVAVIHLEAGLRSRDWTMPEEVNRVVTDRVADLLLCPTDDARHNLLLEGVPDERIEEVGNTMIDSLLRLLPVARRRDALTRFGLAAREYVLVTLHRPAVVDDAALLAATLTVLADLAHRLPVVLPIHPRTRARLREAGTPLPQELLALEPLDYLDFIALEADAGLVITDSGGVQEETTALAVRCLTFRTTTERPITVERGTNELVGVAPTALRDAALRALQEPRPGKPEIALWDGKAGPRAAGSIARFLRRLDRTPSVAAH
jgi:UDP-N-acetylglucosamine 2-epimerase (non-hydrolysing)